MALKRWKSCIQSQLSSYKSNTCFILRDGYFDNLRKVSDYLEGKPLTFIDNIKFVDIFKENHELFSCVITTREICEHISFFKGGIALAEHPKVVFIEINNSQPAIALESSPTKIGQNVIISNSAYISEIGVVIGNNVTIGENVQIYPGVEIEDNVVIKYGSLIDCEDYERCKDENNHVVLAKHKGVVRICSDAQIDEYVIIDRPLFEWDSTKVGAFSYIGKKTYISHGTKIGSCVFIAPCATICGNTLIENDVRIGAGAIIGSRIVIGNNSIVSIGSVVNKSVLPFERVTGNLAVPHEQFMKHLKDMVKQ